MMTLSSYLLRNSSFRVKIIAAFCARRPSGGLRLSVCPGGNGDVKSDEEACYVQGDFDGSKEPATERTVGLQRAGKNIRLAER